MAAGFRLDKWYFDCVSADGELAVVYQANLHFGALTLAYSSCVTYGDKNGVVTASSLRNGPEPQVGVDAIACSLPALQVEGTWRGPVSTAEREIFASPRGSVVWTCWLPAAKGEVAIGSAPKIRGVGYVEHVALTVAPWAMPIDELRWGRFIGDGRSLVWIDWRGRSPRRVVLLDGRVVDEAAIGDEHIAMPTSGVDLRLTDFRVLREGAIGATALSILPKSLRDKFPGRILGLHEQKWRARGELRSGGVTEATGWVIHEVVRWP